MVSSLRPRRTGLATAIAVGVSLFAAVPATAATFLVADDGTDVGDCTVDPCATVQYAIDQHRASPGPADVIEIGPGDFTGNVETDDPADEGLTIRGSASGGQPDTSLHGEGEGAIVGGSPTGIAILLGGCGNNGVTLRNVTVDTVGADPSVMAIELERGSDLIGVEATNQPGSAAFSVVGTCGRGSVIQRSTITGTDEDSAVFSSDGLRVIEFDPQQRGHLDPGPVPAPQRPAGDPAEGQALARHRPGGQPRRGGLRRLEAGARLVVDHRRQHRRVHGRRRRCEQHDHRPR